MTIVRSIDELPALVGEELGLTAWVDVEQAAIDAFGRVTLDEQWIHVDPQRSAEGAFGGTIAHGFFTLSLCSHFLDELLVVGGTRMVVNVGLDRVRFPSPVHVGSRVAARGTLLAAERRGDAVQTVTRLTITSDGAAKPACVADQVSRFYPDDPQGRR